MPGVTWQKISIQMVTPSTNPTLPNMIPARKLPLIHRVLHLSSTCTRWQWEFWDFLVLWGTVCHFWFYGRTGVRQLLHFCYKSLAVADNCFLLLWIITYSVKNYLRFLSPESATQPSYIYTRVYTFPLLYMAQTETIWLTVVIALNRYMAVCMPYKAPHLCTIMNVYKEVIAVTMFLHLYQYPKIL